VAVTARLLELSALRPGRVAVAVWGPRARNPWLGVVVDAVSAQLGGPVPPPGVPGPFALEDADRLGRLLTGAGLAEVVVDEVPVPLPDHSFDAWLTRTSALAGPLGQATGHAARPGPAGAAGPARGGGPPLPVAGRARLPGAQPGRGRAPRPAQGGASPR
jgi:hypothetical protein